MNYIVYVSQAARPFTAEELGALLAHSRTRNTADGITGLLIYRYNSDYRRGNFVQVLEGPDAALADVWSRICKDKRHHTIVEVEEGTSETRMFAEWSMGFKNVESDDLERFEGFSDLGSDKFWQNAKQDKLSEALTLLRSFYEAT